MSIFVLADLILSGINSVQEIFYWLYRVSLLLGYCILLIVLHICEACCALVFSLCEVVKILNDDFEIFISDVVNILLLISAYTNEAFSEITATVLQINREVTSTASNVALGFGSLFENDIYQSIFLNCIQKPSELVFGALCLIGNSACHVVESVCTFVGNIPKLPHLALSYLKKRSVNLGHCILYILTHEAMYGFIIVSGLTYFSYKSRLCHKFGSICQKVFSSVCIIAFEYLGAFIQLIYISVPRIKIKLGFVRSSNDSNLYNRDELQKQLEKEKAEKLCIVCMDSKRNSMFLNCKHLVLCNDCAYTILNCHGVCPVCRSYVSQVIQVYT